MNSRPESPTVPRHQPWESPWDHLEQEEHAEIRLLLWLAETQRAQGRLLVHIAKRMEINQMALIDDIQAAAASTGAAANAAAQRVIDTLNANNQVVADLQAHGAEDDALIATLQAEIAAGTVTPESAQAVIDALTNTRTVIDGIDATPVAALRRK